MPEEPKPNDPPETDPAKGKGKPPPATITLTEDELNQRIESRLQVERDKTASERKREKEDADRKKAEADGEYKTLSEKDREAREAAESERDAAKRDKRRLEVKDFLRDHLAEKHGAYMGAAKYMLPLVDFDDKTDDAEIKKRIGAVVEQYVKDNPREKGSGAPPHAPGRVDVGTVATDRKKQGEGEGNGEVALSMEARRAF